MDHLTDLSCKDFAKVLASRLPVPGGGGAAAMAGALAAALCAMVGNFTSGKKKYAALEGELQQSIARCDALRLRLLELVELDAQAFEPLSRAYSIPRDHPSRQQVMEEASRNACKAPLEMVVCCSQVMTLMDGMLEMGSRLLISDIGCGALLCKAAIEAAALMVFVNTAALSDRAAAAEMDRQVEQALAVCRPMADKIAAAVTAYVRKES